MPSRQLPNDEVENKAPKRSRLLIIVLLLVAFLVSAGGIYLFVYNGNTPATAGNERKANCKQYKLEDFVLNLADPGLRRYLRIRITLEYSQPRLTKELEDKTYRLRDGLFLALSSKMTEDLQDKEALKQELLNTINLQLESGQVDNIYFEEFLIQ
ncbi:MAG: flagellar basal body-associated FliL family protein [Clostridia bacterium]|nr:flagellar basal body-associated FliL family protein [Clostridia bacterium]